MKRTSSSITGGLYDRGDFVLTRNETSSAVLEKHRSKNSDKSEQKQQPRKSIFGSSPPTEGQPLMKEQGSIAEYLLEKEEETKQSIE